VGSFSPGHGLDHLAWTQQRQVGEAFAADDALRGGFGRTDGVVVMSGHLDVLSIGRGRGRSSDLRPGILDEKQRRAERGAGKNAVHRVKFLE